MSFIIFLSIFKEMEFCHLFFVGCSLMFYLSWAEKKRLLKNLKVSSAGARRFCGDVEDARSLMTRQRETYKNWFY